MITPAQRRAHPVLRRIIHRSAPGFAALLALLCVALARADTHPLDQFFPRSTLRIATPDARLHSFDIWVADTDARRVRGLMFVRQLADNQGMLFVYPQSHNIGMWMKNTFLPLDMLFVRADGRVERVVENTTPHSLTTIESKKPVRAVLELKAGTATRLKIRAGARVLHAAFEQGSGRSNER